MTKPKTKAGGSIPKPRIRKPKWLRDLEDLSAPDLALWQAIQTDSLLGLQKRAMIMGKDVFRLRQRNADLREAFDKERRELLGKIAHLQQVQGRTRESQAWGMLNGMLNCLEGNSRAVRALAEPMQEVIGELARELRTSGLPRSYMGGGRHMGKTAASGIPDKWPQPPTGDGEGGI